MKLKHFKGRENSKYSKIKSLAYNVLNCALGVLGPVYRRLMVVKFLNVDGIWNIDAMFYRVKKIRLTYSKSGG